MRLFLLPAIMLIGLVCIATPSHAFIDNDRAKNTISGDDEGKMVELEGRALDLYKDLSSVMLGLAKSGTVSDPEAFGTLLCVEQIAANANLIAFSLYGATSASQISTVLQYELDEKVTLFNIKGLLENTMNSVKSARAQLNQILGGCARQRRLAYDKATSLLALVDDVGKIVGPILQRVTVNMLVPFPRQQ
jgi:hypothetical protein